MLQQEAMIVNKLGLHARAAAKLTQLAARYQCGIWLTRNGRRVNAKSIMGVMLLAAGLENQDADREEALIGSTAMRAHPHATGSSTFGGPPPVLKACSA